MPATIHVPPMAPISSRMMIAGTQLATFAAISFSRFSHSSLFEKCPTSTLTAEATRSDTCEAPSSVALPKTAMQHVTSTISTRNGIKLNIPSPGASS